MTAVHVVVPDAIDDPLRPSGGNVYDRRVCRGLAALGWSVHEKAVPGAWPRADLAARRELSRAIADLPDGAVVLVDGLIASSVPDVLVPEAARLRLVVLVHLPLGDGALGDEATGVRTREQRVLAAAAAVVTTSTWTRRWLLDRYALSPARVHVAEPGVDAADLAPGTAAGGELLCVAAVTPGKGHDVLLDALAEIVDLSWRCVCVGALTRDPVFVDHLGHQARALGISDRVLFAGPRTGVGLDGSYAAADALVLASRAETYGMVVTEALARGIPVVASDVGGLPATLGRDEGGCRPGLLVPPGDPEALAGALRGWLGDPGLRRRLRDVARVRRGTLSGWSATALGVSRVLAQVAA
ncbi:glycosyltransferase family 4 protein [Pengzhenrongella phosphoraccumulans]|uniref:glycosyltransferase family 4 protein n=1 Tax=Pengzhenrongella phosphoraccumulans TaxID=3114394 RepID=UPI00389061C8